MSLCAIKEVEIALEAQIERCRRMVYALAHINTYIKKERERATCQLGAYASTRTASVPVLVLYLPRGSTGMITPVHTFSRTP